MTNKLQDILEQGEKEFRKLEMRGYNIPAGESFAVCSDNTIWRAEDILNWHKEKQHKLLQSIVEMIDAEKSPKITRPIPCPDNNFGCAVYHFEEIEPKENEVLEKFKSKLLELD